MFDAIKNGLQSFVVAIGNSIDKAAEKKAENIINEYYDYKEHKDDISIMSVLNTLSFGVIKDYKGDFFEKVGDIVENSEDAPTYDEAKLHSAYATMASSFFKDKEGEYEIENFIKEEYAKNEKTGFEANVYRNKKTDDVVIIYQATELDDKEDIYNNIQMAGNKMPRQYKDAVALYKQVKEVYPNSKITLSGYSLGGSLAQLVASTYKDADAVCFEPYGTSEIIEENGLNDNGNCTNYATDSSYISSIKAQPGQTKTLVYEGLSDDYKDEGIFTQEFLSRHDIENFTDLENAKYKDSAKEGVSRLLLSNKLSPVNKFIEKFV